MRGMARGANVPRGTEGQEPCGVLDEELLGRALPAGFCYARHELFAGAHYLHPRARFGAGIAYQVFSYPRCSETVSVPLLPLPQTPHKMLRTRASAKASSSGWSGSSRRR